MFTTTNREEWCALGRDTLLQLREDLNLLDDQVRFADEDQLDELAVCTIPARHTKTQHTL